MDLCGRSLLNVTDLSAEEFLDLVELASMVREEKQKGLLRHRLAGRSIALIFEKTSTRTRSAFEVAAHDEGAHITYLGPQDTHLGDTESVKDTARVLGRMFDGIEFRGYSQSDAETLARFSGIPVWNGLTGLWHPNRCWPTSSPCATTSASRCRTLPAATWVMAGTTRRTHC